MHNIFLFDIGYIEKYNSTLYIHPFISSPKKIAISSFLPPGLGSGLVFLYQLELKVLCALIPPSLSSANSVYLPIGKIGRDSSILQFSGSIFGQDSVEGLF